MNRLTLFLAGNDKGMANDPLFSTALHEPDNFRSGTGLRLGFKQIKGIDLLP
jgi:hypothetical protein